MKPYQALVTGLLLLACFNPASGQPQLAVSKAPVAITTEEGGAIYPLRPRGMRGHWCTASELSNSQSLQTKVRVISRESGDVIPRYAQLSTTSPRPSPPFYQMAEREWSTSRPNFMTVGVGGEDANRSSLPASAAIKSTSAPTEPSENLILTGLAHIGSVKCAFIQIEQTGRPIRYYTLKEGEGKGAIQMLAVDAVGSRVVLRHHGLIRELKLREARPTPVDAERQKDLSHSQHHALRARLEREQDERAASEAIPEVIPTPVRH